MYGIIALVTGALLLAHAPTSHSAVVRRQDASDHPTVALDNGTFTGVTEGPVAIFRGIPFAQPPSVKVMCFRAT